ncbi:hypothetical protein [Cellulomonas sp. HZM]|uniref:hypothetical protein n=1 Tax=Cellulomonas sp. HZM TaxID=1454010 RepID=UPI0012DFA8DC|nr:hypothetical protein [Cellulomonas sp. HZM]
MAQDLAAHASGVFGLPAELDGMHVLALPPGADVVALARAWFGDARWEREPVAAVRVARPMTGARFRGIAVQEEQPGVQGLLRLDEEAALVGPVPLPATHEHGPRDLYGLEHVGQAALDRAAGWMTATARHVGGLVLPADRVRAIAPDPEARIDLTLWTAIPMTTADVVPLVRPALSGARLSPVDVPAPPGGAPQPFTITAAYEYDGAVRLRMHRPRATPVALQAVDWREHGPWAYEVSWQPLEPGELTTETPSPLHVIARQRVAPSIARVTSALWRACGGTVLDGGGFVVTPDELRDRASRR